MGLKFTKLHENKTVQDKKITFKAKTRGVASHSWMNFCSKTEPEWSMISKSVLVSMQTPGGVDHIDLPQFFSFIFKIYFKVSFNGCSLNYLHHSIILRVCYLFIKRNISE